MVQGSGFGMGSGLGLGFERVEERECGKKKVN